MSSTSFTPRPVDCLHSDHKTLNVSSSIYPQRLSHQSRHSSTSILPPLQPPSYTQMAPHNCKGYSVLSIFSGYLIPPCFRTSSITPMITQLSSHPIPSLSSLPSFKHLAHSSASQNMPCPGISHLTSFTFLFPSDLTFCTSCSSKGTNL